MKQDFLSSSVRRIYLDMDARIVSMATQKAAKARVSRKRYIEALIEKDCALKRAK